MKEYILEVKKLIPKNLCDKIITYFDEDMFDATVTDPESPLQKNIRNCLTKSILQPKTFGETICSNAAQEKIFQCAQHYESLHPMVSTERISQLDLLKYESNEYEAGYNFHKDFGNNCFERHLSISICLNNDFLGGEFVFKLPEGQYTVAQNVGDAIVFPSNFMFPHQVKKIIKGTRYALIGWVI